jgi:replication factor A1
MNVNPDIPEAHMLRGWYDSVGHEQTFQTYSGIGGGGSVGAFNRAEIRTLNDVKEAELGTSDHADFFSCRGTVMHIKGDNLAYPACPTSGCNKKVLQESDGWRCEKCDRTYPKPEYRYSIVSSSLRTLSSRFCIRYIISMAVSDYTGQAWLQGFNDVGVAVFGMPADDFIQIKVCFSSILLNVVESLSFLYQ